MYYYPRHEDPTNPDTINYVVKAGDNLWNIAKAYKTTTNELMKYNNLNSTLLYPGQVLLIPTQVAGGITLYPYTTQKNDSVNKIAQQYGIGATDINNHNDMNGLLLEPNQTLNLPLPKTYTIQQGDTLDSILKKFNLNVRDLIGLNPHWLAPGQIITVRK